MNVTLFDGIGEPITLGTIIIYKPRSRHSNLRLAKITSCPDPCIRFPPESLRYHVKGFVRINYLNLRTLRSNASPSICLNTRYTYEQYFDSIQPLPTIYLPNSIVIKDPKLLEIAKKFL